MLLDIRNVGSFKQNYSNKFSNMSTVYCRWGGGGSKHIVQILQQENGSPTTAAVDKALDGLRWDGQEGNGWQDIFINKSSTGTLKRIP